jgi:hypothetical protein
VTAQSTPEEVDQFIAGEGKNIERHRNVLRVYGAVADMLDQKTKSREQSTGRYAVVMQNDQSAFRVELAVAENRILSAYARRHAQEFLWRTLFIPGVERSKLVRNFAAKVQASNSADVLFGEVAAAAAAASSPSNAVDLTGDNAGGAGGGGGGDGGDGAVGK